MALDKSGLALAKLMIAALGPQPPANPTPEQLSSYNQTVADQATAYSVILTYLCDNTVVTVPAAGILDGYGHACTGTGTGTID